MIVDVSQASGSCKVLAQVRRSPRLMANALGSCEVERAPFGAIPKLGEQRFLLSRHSPRLEAIRKVGVLVYVLPLYVTSSVATNPLAVDIDVNVKVKRAFNVDGEIGRWYGLPEC